MADALTIDRTNKLLPSEDYDFLRKQGISLIQDLSGKVWTDYNTHDPGITLLEALCYALTDLGYRTSFDIKDILASKTKNTDNWEKVFYTARQILPCNAVTLTDYRKIIIDTEGVRNAWVETSEESEILMSLQQEEGDENEPTKYSLKSDAESGEDVLRLRGLYKVYVQYEDEVVQRQKEEQVAKKIKNKLASHRNLCEDFISVASVDEEIFRIEAELVVSEGTDIEKINATIYAVIHDFLSPAIIFYSLAQMMERGSSAEEIFEGPLLKHGFIDTAELENSERSKDIHLSDIIRIVSGIEGVIAIKKLELPLDAQSAYTDFTQWFNSVKDKQKVAKLDIDHSEIIFVRSGDRHRATSDKKPDKNRVKAIFSFLQSSRLKSRLKEQSEDLSIPSGDFMNIAEYFPFQKNLPAAYGTLETYIDTHLDERSINAAVVEIANKRRRLSDKTIALRDVAIDFVGKPLEEIATTEDIYQLKEGYKKSQIDQLEMGRKQKLQLRGFLMIFEQILSDFLSQLAATKQLFSFDDKVDKTYFPQQLKEISDVESLFIDYKKYTQSYVQHYETEEQFIQRKDKMLDHLLGRFAEDMSKYSYYLQAAKGRSAGKILLDDKKRFLADYVQISNYRGKAFNYINSEEIWNSNNVSGMKKRICRMLGIKDYSTKFIASDSIRIEKTMPDDKITRYVVVLSDPQNKEHILLESVEYEFESEAREILNYILTAGFDEHLYVKEGHKDKWSYQLKRPTQEDDFEIVAGKYFHEKHHCEEAFEKTIETIKTFSEAENFHLVEHILLRPKVQNRQKSGKKINTLDTDSVDLLSINTIEDATAPAIKKHEAAAYKFKIINVKTDAKKNKAAWKLSLLKNDDSEILSVDEEFVIYKHLTRRIEQIRQFGADVANYIIDENSDGYYLVSIKDGDRILATNKKSYRLKEDLDAEVANLVNFFSYQQKVSESKEDNYDDFTFYADPYSLQVSIVIPDWPEKFRNPTFRHLLEKTIYLETPAHIYAHVYWLDHNQLRQFEEAYKLWLEELTTGEIPNTEIVNNLVSKLNELRR